MHFRLLAFVGLAGLLLGPPAAVAAATGCCQGQERCCVNADTADAAPCCKHHSVTHDPTPADILLAMAPPSAATAPVRQSTMVWFHQPVMVGRQILQGQYVIEHDNDRMARGEPCTHIYAFNDRTTPVAAFNCIHLEREASKDGTVVLEWNGLGMQRLVEFQFAGESAAHGLATVR